MNLGEFLPFKYKSMMCAAPPLKEAQAANYRMSQLIHELQTAILKSEKSLPYTTIDDYNYYASIANKISHHFPKNISEVIPVQSDRCAETIIEELHTTKTMLSYIILYLHNKSFLEYKSHLLASRSVMKMLSARFDKILFGGVNYSSLKESGFEIIDTNFVFLNSYQHLQERYETVSEVEKINNYLQKNEDIIILLLSIQSKICKYLTENMNKHTEFISSPVGFQEIGIPDFENNVIIPSPRFLKIIIHNLAKYFIQFPQTYNTREILKFSLDKAKQEHLFSQYIFVFRKEQGKQKVFGITLKVCPAMNYLGDIIKWYL